ncbi:pyruvate kinase [Paenibacillus darwinianus]|nr:pyruvate kinase [Paenibacillus darwinianus]
MRSEALFGTKRDAESPHIMLTLDVRMLASPVIEQFLANGMTIARINCAHGDRSIWTKLIEAVRGAEEQLRGKGQYRGQACKIYMDLAGPKIRVGPIRKTGYPLKISVKKNEYGQPLESLRGFIGPHPPAASMESSQAFDFEIPILPHDKLHLLKEGDRLAFRDIRGKRRTLLVLQVMPSGLEASLDQTAYLDEHTTLYNEDYHINLRVASLAKKPVRLFVKKSDSLRIYLNDKLEGDYSPTGVACISVSLPQAFTKLREGHSVFIDDGKVHGIVYRHNERFVDVKVVAPDYPIVLKEGKGINLPDSNVGKSITALTGKDTEDLAFIAEHADMVGVSFVHDANDLRRLKELLDESVKSDIAVIAKIETREAVHHFSSLLLEGLTFARFGVMVARGDLAIEIGFQQLSVVQEEILAMSRAAHVPVILATQVLDTMAKKGMPSRAELADLSFGSEFDCVMLNKGPFMKETVSFLQETLLLLNQVKHHTKTITRLMHD